MMYTGISMNLMKSYPGKFLYRGSSINKNEIQKINEYNEKGKLSTVVVFQKLFYLSAKIKLKQKIFVEIQMKLK